MTTPAFRVLFACTGNLCRSPAAEIITRHLLKDRQGDRCSGFELASAGTDAIPDREIATFTGAALSALGLGAEARAFRARRLDAEMTGKADLVLTAERAHRRAAVTLAPAALRRTFTIREFARLLMDVERPPGADPAERARTAVLLAHRRRGTRGHVPGELDAIEDPIRLPRAAHHATIERITQSMEIFVEFIAGATMTGQDRNNTGELLDPVKRFPPSPVG